MPPRRSKNKLPQDYPSYQLRQPPLDLFGGVVVTHDDVFDWVRIIAPRYCQERSYDGYVRSYNVAAKVAQAKIRGDWERITARAQRRPWHERLSLDVIDTFHP